MKDILWRIVNNLDGPFYWRNNGAGFVSWQSGYFINFDMSAVTHSELTNLCFDVEFAEYIFEAVALCDELIFKTFDVDYGKE